MSWYNKTQDRAEVEHNILLEISERIKRNITIDEVKICDCLDEDGYRVDFKVCDLGNLTRMSRYDIEIWIEDDSIVCAYANKKQSKLGNYGREDAIISLADPDCIQKVLEAAFNMIQHFLLSTIKEQENKYLLLQDVHDMFNEVT